MGSWVLASLKVKTLSLYADDYITNKCILSQELYQTISIVDREVGEVWGDGVNYIFQNTLLFLATIANDPGIYRKECPQLPGLSSLL